MENDILFYCLAIVCCITLMVIIFQIVTSKRSDGSDTLSKDHLGQDHSNELGSTILRDKRIQEKSEKIQDRLLKTKARLNSDGPKTNSKPQQSKPISIKNLAGEITEEELLQDKKRIEQKTISNDPNDSEKSTSQLLDDFEKRNNISSVGDLENKLIEYDSNSMSSFTE